MTSDLGQDLAQLLCVFAFYSGACSLSSVTKFKSSLIFHDLGFIAHDFRQAQDTYYTYLSFRACSVH